MVLETGYTSFSARQWSDITECDIKQADYDCRFLYEKGLVDRDRRDNRFVYSLRIIKGEEKTLVQDGERPGPFDMTPATEEPDTVAGESPPDGPAFFRQLGMMERSKSDLVQRIAATVREMLAKGITRFSRADWAEMTGMDKKQMCDACDYLVAHKLVVNLSQFRNRSEYMFTLQEEGPLEEEMVSVEVPDGDYSPLLIAHLQKMVTAGSSERDQRIGSFILNMIDNSIERFSTEDWVEAFHVTKPVYTNDLRRAVNFGLLRKENPRGNSTHYNLCRSQGPV
jgi:hypothetical protein